MYIFFFERVYCGRLCICTSMYRKKNSSMGLVTCALIAGGCHQYVARATFSAKLIPSVTRVERLTGSIHETSRLYPKERQFNRLNIRAADSSMCGPSVTGSATPEASIDTTLSPTCTLCFSFTALHMYLYAPFLPRVAACISYQAASIKWLCNALSASAKRQPNAGCLPAAQHMV